MKLRLPKLFPNRGKNKKNNEVKTRTPYNIEHSVKEWQGKLSLSDKVDINLLQDVIDRLLEDNDGKYLKELNELNIKHSVKIVKHKKEARISEHIALKRMSIERSVIPLLPY